MIDSAIGLRDTSFGQPIRQTQIERLVLLCIAHRYQKMWNLFTLKPSYSVNFCFLCISLWRGAPYPGLPHGSYEFVELAIS